MNKPKILHIGLCVQPPPINGLQKAFIENSSEYAEVSSGLIDVNRVAGEKAKSMNPDIVFMQIQCEGVIHKATVRMLRNLGAYVVNWNGDVRDHCPPWMVFLGGDYSNTLFANMRDVNEMRARGFKSDWLEIGYDPEIYCQDGPVIQTYPIVFFGNNAHRFPMSQFRYQMCNFLMTKFYGNFGVYGLHTGADGNFNHSQRDEAAGYRFAKIAINCSHYEIEKYSSDRMLRILGTGKPICLSKWYPGIDEVYVDGEHLRTWKTLDEVEALIHYYQDSANEQERLRIVKQGMEHVQKNFTFDRMVKNLIKLYNDEQ